MKHNFYRSAGSDSGVRGIWQTSKKLHYAFAIVVTMMAGAWTSRAWAQTLAGTQLDTYVINNDNSNNPACLRLQNHNFSGWNMTNQGDLYWSFAANSTHTDPGGTKMLLTKTGRLGIGVVAPASTLDVGGNIQMSNALIPMGLMTELPGTTTPLLNMSVNFRQSNLDLNYVGASFRIDTRSDYPLFHWTRRTAGQAINQEKVLMGLQQNGNLYLNGGDMAIGLGSGGVNSPQTKGKLHVVGSLHVENQAGDQTFHVSAERQLVFVGDSAYLKFTASTASSPIQQNNFSLWVSKGIVSEDFAIADPDDWADFVFDKNYDLNSLAKVEAYIREHGHLPEMPSEADVKENGYSIHDINRKLLQKIEELTLYAIEQEKKVEVLMQQRARLDELASRLSKLENSK